MKTILLTGSPKGNAANSASFFLAKAFSSGMQEPCEIRSIAKENHKELLKIISQFEQIIVITPNYIHSVPSAVLDFLYALPIAVNKQRLGFIIQSGYPEAVESEIASRLFKRFANRLGYQYLGTVIKGECAGIAIMPQMFQKLEKQFMEFGALFEKTGRFDQHYIKSFSEPYTLSKFQVCLFNMTSPLSKHFTWHKVMKTNHAYKQRLNKPYLDQSH